MQKRPHFKSRMDPKTSPKPTRNLYAACISSYLAALSMGYVLGYSSPALPLMTGEEGPLDKDTESWFGSVVTIGGMLGCPLAGWLVERLGRKRALMSTSLPFLFGWGCIMVCSEVTWLCLGRFLTGVGCGMVTVSAPMFIAEISTKELRGMLGSGIQLAITVGILLVYTLGMYLSWRALAFGGFIIPIAALALTFRAPETPRYLLARGQKPEALRSLAWLRGPQCDTEEECRDMEESLDTEDNSVTWNDFCRTELYQPLRVSVGLMIFQQMTGINVVMFYTVSIFQSAGFKEGGHFATVVVGAVQVVATVIACGLMDKAGRRILLLAASIGMGVSCFMMGYYYSQTVTPDAAAEAAASTTDLSWLAMVSLIVYVIAFSLGWGPIPMLVMSEIFPVKARGSASAVASIVNWTFAFLVTKEFSALQLALGQGGAFCFFGVCCIVGLLFVLKFVPETKGKSLEDIELYFLGRAMRGI